MSRPNDEELGKLLHQIKYKNWEFWIEDFFGVYLVARVPVTCSRSGKAIHLRLTWGLPKRRFKNASVFVKWVFAKILWFERHEAAEWFSFQGRCVFNPHSRRPPQIMKETKNKNGKRKKSR